MSVLHVLSLVPLVQVELIALANPVLQLTCLAVPLAILYALQDMDPLQILFYVFFVLHNA